MKVPKSFSVDLDILQAAMASAKATRDTMSKWVEDAIVEKLAREGRALPDGTILTQDPPEQYKAPAARPKRQARG